MVVLMVVLMFSCKTNSNQQEESRTTTEEITYPDLVVYSSFDDLYPRLSTSSDSLYVVNFWATWCKPCVEELPYFMEAEKELRNEKVKFVYVSLDFKSKIDTKLKPFLEEGKLKGEVIALTDNKFNDWIDRVSKNWTGSIPGTLIFDKKKRKFYEQSFDYEELEKTIKKHLNS